MRSSTTKSLTAPGVVDLDINGPNDAHNLAVVQIGGDFKGATGKTLVSADGKNYHTVATPLAVSDGTTSFIKFDVSCMKSVRFELDSIASGTIDVAINATQSPFPFVA
jgi:hypothetical protein